MRGFTLVEVLVALAISGMALLAAVGILTSIEDRSVTLETANETTTRDANAEWLLREIAANVATTGDTTRELTGDSSTVVLATWCRTAQGWLVRCAARVSFVSGTQSVLIVRLVGADTATMTVREGARVGIIRYLVSASHGGQWADRWSKLDLPAAIAVITGRDTLVLAVGHGG